MQRAIMEYLEVFESADIGDLTECVYSPGYYDDESKRASISRAITSLEKKGLVKRGKRYSDDYQYEHLPHRTVEIVKC